MSERLVIPAFELIRSPFLQAMMNERWLGVWSFWGDVHPAFADRKQDVEWRVAAIMRDNDAEALAQLALSDRYLREGYSGPRKEHFDLDGDAVRLGAFKALEAETRRAAGELRVASLAPATETDLVCAKTPACLTRCRLATASSGSTVAPGLPSAAETTRSSPSATTPFTRIRSSVATAS